jgi:Sulfotransferase family
MSPIADETVTSADGKQGGPVFVVGIWRSGTSLLCTLLNQHPQIAVLYEGELPLLWPMFRVPWVRSDWARRWDFWNDALRRHQINPTDLPASITDLGSAMEAACRAYARKKGATVWGCKSPNYYDCMDRLAKVFPAARFIAIWRRPEEICDSIIRAAAQPTWFARRGTLHRALLGYEVLKKQCDRLTRWGVPLHQLQYEELVKQPDVAMQGVCEFLEVPFHVRITSIQDADTSAIYSAGHHASVKGSRIEAARDRSVLPAQLQSKLARYERHGHRKYNRSWPAYAVGKEEDGPAAGFFERVFDKAAYGLARALDSAPPLAYPLVPLALWTRYRALKYPAQAPFWLPQRSTPVRASITQNDRPEH